MMKYIYSFLVILFITNCTSTKPTQYTQEKHFTLATIKQLKKGMAQETVLSITVTPNIITSTKSGEQWVYDKIRTEHYEKNNTTQKTIQNLTLLQICSLYVHRKTQKHIKTKIKNISN